MITRYPAITIPREALRCRKCYKADVQFPENTSTNGRRFWCVECIRAYYAGYREKNRAAVNQRVQQWREKNKDHLREYSKENRRRAYWANPEYHRQKAIRLRRKLKDEVYAAYGGYKCWCCGETTPEFLTIDHISNNGAEHRQRIGRCGNNLLWWIKKHNYPADFQILCWNCQWGKRLAGTCPHQRTRND